MRTQRIKAGIHSRAIWAVMVVGLTGVQACDQEASEKRRVERAAKEQLAKEKRRLDCATVDEALSVVSLQGRTDLAEPTKRAKGCRRIYVEECPYKVELMYELGKATRSDLRDKIAKIGFEKCTEEFQFANKYGIEAFRDHRKLLETAVEAATEDPRDYMVPERER